MGIDFNSAILSCGLKPYINNNARPQSINFGQQSFDDKFEPQSIERYSNPKLIEKLIAQNPQIPKILNEVNCPLKVNFEVLKPLLDNHCKDVQQIANGISENLPFSLQLQVDKKALSDAAYLHDIGKILIPDEVLNKNGKHNEEEAKIMHKHSELSYEILKNTNLNDKTLKLIRNHHQNAKRTGYPFVNKDFKADLNLQILTIADKYSALTEKRVYKKAFTPKEALTIIYKDVSDGKLNPLIFNSLRKFVSSQEKVTLPNAINT